MKKHFVTIEYFILNFKVLPAVIDTKNYYGDLLQRLFNSKIVITYKNDFIYRITKLDRVSNGDFYYGVISKFVSFEDIEWVQNFSEEQIDYEIPSNVTGRKASYEFVFIPSKHRFAFIKKGRIDQNVKRRGAPLKAIAEILETGFNILLEPENKSCIVNIHQTSQIFEEIYQSDILSLNLTISYSNPDIGEDSEKYMDDLLRESNIGKASMTLKPDDTGHMNTNTKFIRGLIDLARENGKIKAKISNDEGVKTINTIEHPEVRQVSTESSGEIEFKLLNLVAKDIMSNGNG